MLRRLCGLARFLKFFDFCLHLCQFAFGICQLLGLGCCSLLGSVLSGEVCFLLFQSPKLEIYFCIFIVMDSFKVLFVGFFGVALSCCCCFLGLNGVLGLFTFLLLGELSEGWLSCRGLLDHDVMEIETFGVRGPWVGGLLLWWSHRGLVFELRTRVGASVGIKLMITRQIVEKSNEKAEGVELK